MDAQMTDREKFLEATEGRNIDFIDIGSGRGDSMFAAKRLFDAGEGLGFDLDEKKCEIAKENGFNVLCMNALKLNRVHNVARFVQINHVLEHLPSIKDAAFTIQSGMALAKEFMFIRQPYFDADGALMRRGCKLYWSDWHGHPNRMTTLEFDVTLRPLKAKGLVKRYVICARDRITSRKHPAIHPLSALRDQGPYDPTIHPPKDSIRPLWGIPIYSETIAFIDKVGSETSSYDLYRERFPDMDVILDSDQS